MHNFYKKNRGLLWLVTVLLSVVFDQITKYLAVVFLKPVATVPIIKNALHLTYVTNYGAAFGILSDHRWVFLVISTLAIAVLSVLLLQKKNGHPLLCLSMSFIIGGGIGNMIDRIMLGYVVDFIDFRIINFAVFNVADIFVCVGCALMFLWILFVPEASGNKTTTQDTDDTKDTTDTNEGNGHDTDG